MPTKHGLTIVLDDDGAWCAPSVNIALRADHVSEFSGGRENVNAVIRDIRQFLSLTCPAANVIAIDGEVAGDVVFNGRASADQGWVVTVVGDEPKVATMPTAPEPSQQGVESSQAQLEQDLSAMQQNMEDRIAAGENPMKVLGEFQDSLRDSGTMERIQRVAVAQAQAQATAQASGSTGEIGKAESSDPPLAQKALVGAEPTSVPLAPQAQVEVPRVAEAENSAVAVEAAATDSLPRDTEAGSAPESIIAQASPAMELEASDSAAGGGEPELEETSGVLPAASEMTAVDTATNSVAKPAPTADQQPAESAAEPRSDPIASTERPAKSAPVAVPTRRAAKPQPVSAASILAYAFLLFLWVGVGAGKLYERKEVFRSFADGIEPIGRRLARLMDQAAPARMSRPALLGGKRALDAATFGAAIKGRVVGQDLACEVAANSIAEAIKVKSTTGPLARLVILGPEASARARFVETLAVELDRPLVQMPSSSAELVSELRSKDDAVLVVADLEVSSPELMGSFESGWSKGVVTDPDGKVASCSNAILIIDSSVAYEKMIETSEHHTGDTERERRAAGAALVGSGIQSSLIEEANSVLVLRELHGVDAARAAALDLQANVLERFGYDVGVIDAPLLQMHFQAKSNGASDGTDSIVHAINSELEDSLAAAHHGEATAIRLVATGSGAERRLAAFPIAFVSDSAKAGYAPMHPEYTSRPDVEETALSTGPSLAGRPGTSSTGGMLGRTAVVSMTGVGVVSDEAERNRTTAMGLALLGAVGTHHFYLGDYKKGGLALMFSWTGIPALLGFKDAYRLFRMTDAEFTTKWAPSTVQVIGRDS